MIKYKQRKKRFFEELSEAELFTLLKEKFTDRPLKLKYDIKETDVRIKEIYAEKKSVLITTEESYAPGQDKIIICSALLDRYFEIDFEILEPQGPGIFLVRIHGGRRATTGRADLRFKVKPGDVVATNFKVSKQTIDISMFNMPTGIKVIVDQFVLQNKSRYDFFEVGYFETDDTLLSIVRKTSNSLFIEELQKSDSYAPIMEDFIDPSVLIDRDFNKYIGIPRDKGFQSVMMVPIIYITDNEMSIPFAYIRIATKSRKLTIEDYLLTKETTFKLIDRIRDANTQMFEIKQQILDISRGGVRILFDNSELKKYMIKAKGFVFDIVFKLQQPITIYGEIKFTAVNEDNNIVIGMSFTGNSSRKNEMNHLYSVLKPMEIEYKRRLIKQLRGGPQ